MEKVIQKFNYFALKHQTVSQEQIMKYIKLTLFLAFLFSSPLSLRAQENEVAIAKSQLDRQLKLIEKIYVQAEHFAQARMIVLKKQTEKVAESIAQNGLSHARTMHEYQHLIVAYRYSIAFFKDIETESTSNYIVELLKITEDITKARGFDDSPYTQITSHVLRRCINSLYS